MNPSETRTILAPVKVTEAEIAEFCRGCGRHSPKSNICLPPMSIESPRTFQAERAHEGRCGTARVDKTEGTMTRKGFIPFE